MQPAPAVCAVCARLVVAKLFAVFHRTHFVACAPNQHSAANEPMVVCDDTTATPWQNVLGVVSVCVFRCVSDSAARYVWRGDIGCGHVSERSHHQCHRSRRATLRHIASGDICVCGVFATALLGAGVDVPRLIATPIPEASAPHSLCRYGCGFCYACGMLRQGATIWIC